MMKANASSISFASMTAPLVLSSMESIWAPCTSFKQILNQIESKQKIKMNSTKNAADQDKKYTSMLGAARLRTSSMMSKIGLTSTSRPSGAWVPWICFSIVLSSDAANIRRSPLAICLCDGGALPIFFSKLHLRTEKLVNILQEQVHCSTAVPSTVH